MRFCAPPQRQHSGRHDCSKRLNSHKTGHAWRMARTERPATDPPRRVSAVRIERYRDATADASVPPPLAGGKVVQVDGGFHLEQIAICVGGEVARIERLAGLDT